MGQRLDGHAAVARHRARGDERVDDRLLGRADRAWPAPDNGGMLGARRITSYNVCYTKLLRASSSSTALTQISAALPRVKLWQSPAISCPGSTLNSANVCESYNFV